MRKKTGSLVGRKRGKDVPGEARMWVQGGQRRQHPKGKAVQELLPEAGSLGLCELIWLGLKSKGCGDSPGEPGSTDSST